MLFTAVAYLLGLLLPVTLGAQGGDAVYRSIRTEIPIAREYLEPQGLQDAASDVLTTERSISSNTYENVLSASVTVGESGDAVLIHVIGRFGNFQRVPPTDFCMIRLARGLTEIQEWDTRGLLDWFVFDTTFVDAPPVGTHVYALQMKRMVGSTCQAFVGGQNDTLRSIPLPSMLVQSFYGGAIP